MKPILHAQALELANSNAFILRECSAQIAKDLDFDEHWLNGEPHTADFIKISLQKKLSELLSEGSSAHIQQLLYRVDVNEVQLSREMERGSRASLAKLLAELIVKRELQKVIVRNIYSGKLKV